MLRRAFGRISDDQRVQAIVIAFCFGALIEALAGGGSPVAICAVMLIAIGFHPLKAAALALIADTAPVAFGGMGSPITVLGSVTGLPADDFGAMVGRQTPFLALLIPFVLIFVADGRRGLRNAWPAALAAGSVFAVAQFVFSNYAPYQLADIFAAVLAAGAVVVLVRVWKPAQPLQYAGSGIPALAGGAADEASPALARKAGRPSGDSRTDVLMAFAPYAIIVAVFSIAQIGPVKEWLATLTQVYTWPGFNIQNAAGKAVPTLYELNWASATRKRARSSRSSRPSWVGSA